jgi:hypothetical protein
MSEETIAEAFGVREETRFACGAATSCAAALRR